MKIVKKNKRAQFDYLLIKRYIAGIVLQGAEVKQIKAGHIDLAESYVRLQEKGLYLWNAIIPQVTYAEIIPDREKKLLLKKKEIQEISRSIEQKGITIIPVVIGLEHGLIKVEIAVARGKKRFDKRETIKKRETDRMLRRMTMAKG